MKGKRTQRDSAPFPAPRPLLLSAFAGAGEDLVAVPGLGLRVTPNFRVTLFAGPELAARVATVRAERDRMATQLTGLGWEIPSSQANFLWIAAGEAQATAAARLCTESKIVVRQSPGGLRVTIGTEEENGRLLDALGSPADLPSTPSAAGGRSAELPRVRAVH